ncbi:DUF6053 domain-containing protein [Lysobacter sp. CA199]
MGGPSGPTLFGRAVATGTKGVGPEGPPTKGPAQARPHAKQPPRGGCIR